MTGPNLLPDGTTGTNKTPRVPDSEAARQGDTARTHWEHGEWSPHASNQRHHGGSEAPGEVT